MSKIGKQQLSKELLDMLSSGGSPGGEVPGGQTPVVVANAIVSDDEPSESSSLWFDIEE